MQQYPYWHQQTIEKPLYPEIAWAKPEQRQMAGKLGIIGGNKLGFISVAESYETTLKAGAGEVKVLLPDVLRKSMPSTMTNVIYGASNPSGSLARDSITEMKTIGSWATAILMIGDSGRNSETAILYEDFIREYTGPLTITRDAIDLIKNSTQTLVDRPNTLIVASFAQLQKMFQSVYYPKILTFSMQLTNLVEALHKFTITYPINIVVFHREVMLVAGNGEVTSTPWTDQMKIWRGKTASIAATYWLWNSSKTVESVTASLLDQI